ncbi:DUF4156 domain-containing protein [Vibrio sp. T187]|uniref:DUF4156 domain-containing protein n=1 Tax=Vibrio TaxID=662 RepID=UPI0010C962E6|nr:MULTISPECIES: DUF4156 domain-containing protein [Vibrio]MBW3694402.1 DUF4156 domain-containing protein [Vibrio sp. T187]
MGKILFSILTSVLLIGCTTPTKVIREDAKNIELDLHGSLDINQCQFLGEVTGSEGHWYSYLFYPNDTLVQGAVNELKNNALSLGADTVVFSIPQDFATSVTILGVAYQCSR